MVCTAMDWPTRKRRPAPKTGQITPTAATAAAAAGRRPPPPISAAAPAPARDRPGDGTDMVRSAMELLFWPRWLAVANRHGPRPVG